MMGRRYGGDAVCYDVVKGEIMDFNLRPAIVIWEVTQACQLACVHCRAEARPGRDAGELSSEEGFALVDQVAGAGAPLMVLTGGDPMERPDIAAFVRRGVERGLRVGLSPSATPKVTPQSLRELKAAGLHRLALSLDSHLEHKHDAFRRVPGSFRRTMEIARDVRDIGIPLQIGTTISALNASELEPMAEIVGRLGAVLWSVFFIVPTGRANPALMISAEVCEKALYQLHDIARVAPFAVKTTEAPHYRRVVAERTGRKPASGVNDGKGFVFVSHWGDVFPSGFLPVKAGNVRERPLGDIYRDSPLFKALRDPGRLNGRCGICEFRTFCGGSRARAHAVSGDPLGEDPLCSYVPEAPCVAEAGRSTQSSPPQRPPRPPSATHPPHPEAPTTPPPAVRAE